MKTLMIPLIAVAMLAASCSSTKQTASGKNDDVYVTQTTPSAAPTPSEGSYNPSQDNYNNGDQSKTDDSYQSPDYSTNDQYVDSNGTTYVTNNYYGSGGGWYNSQLYAPSVGFNFGYPFYSSPGFSFSIGFGYGYGYGYGYYPWYYPYGYYNPWYGYGYGYGCYNPYYGYGYGGGYCNGGYYGDYNSSYYGYYGYRGASASNTSGGDYGGRHYKIEGNSDGENGNSVTNGQVNSNLVDAGNGGRNILGGTVQQSSSGSLQNTGINGRNNPSGGTKDLQNQGQDQNVHQRELSNPSNDRNISAPERNSNYTTPRQNNAQGGPRNFTRLNPSISNGLASAPKVNHSNSGVMTHYYSSAQQQNHKSIGGIPMQMQPNSKVAMRQQPKNYSQPSASSSKEHSSFLKPSGSNYSNQRSQPQVSHQNSYSRGNNSGGSFGGSSGGGSSAGARSGGSGASRR